MNSEYINSIKDNYNRNYRMNSSLEQVRQFWDELNLDKKEKIMCITDHRIVHLVLEQLNQYQLILLKDIDEKYEMQIECQNELHLSVYDPYYLGNLSQFENVNDLTHCIIILLNHMPSLSNDELSAVHNKYFSDASYLQNKTCFLKVRLEKLDHYFKLMSNTIQDFCLGAKNVIKKKDYWFFFERVMQNTLKNTSFSVSQKIQTLMNSICILMENNILKHFKKYLKQANRISQSTQTLENIQYQNMPLHMLHYNQLIDRIHLENMEIKLKNKNLEQQSSNENLNLNDEDSQIFNALNQKHKTKNQRQRKRSIQVLTQISSSKLQNTFNDMMYGPFLSQNINIFNGIFNIQFQNSNKIPHLNQLMNPQNKIKYQLQNSFSQLSQPYIRNRSYNRQQQQQQQFQNVKITPPGFVDHTVI